MAPFGQGVLVATIVLRGGTRLALPKGHIEAGERPEDAAVRETREETGLSGSLVGPLGETSYQYWSRGERARVSKRVDFFLMRYRAGSPRHHDAEVEGVRLLTPARALTALAYPGERQVMQRAVAWLERATARYGTPGGMSDVYALNFYSPLFIDQLRKGRKTATIRLGDKGHKYKKGQLVWVTVGHRHGPRQKIFAAIIDQVDVKPIRELTQREIERDNPEFRLVEDTIHFLSHIYSREVGLDDQVSIIHFSEVVEYPSLK